MADDFSNLLELMGDDSELNLRDGDPKLSESESDPFSFGMSPFSSERSIITSKFLRTDQIKTIDLHNFRN